MFSAHALILLDLDAVGHATMLAYWKAACFLSIVPILHIPPHWTALLQSGMLGSDVSDETEKERCQASERHHRCIKGGEWAVVQSRQMAQMAVVRWFGGKAGTVISAGHDF